MDNIFRVKLLDEKEKEEIEWNIKTLEYARDLMLKNSDGEAERAFEVGYRLGICKTILEISETLRKESGNEKEDEEE